MTLRADPTAIRFYSVTDEHGELSNFAEFPIQLDGKRSPTVEHYFQAQKRSSPAEQEAIRRAKTPGIAARMGRDRKVKLRRDWESAKVDVMRRAVDAKFRQHDDLCAPLVPTGDARLIEHTEESLRDAP